MLSIEVPRVSAGSSIGVGSLDLKREVQSLWAHIKNKLTVFL